MYGIVLVFDLPVCLPYSKLTDVLYRPVALVYAEYSRRNGGVAATA